MPFNGRHRAVGTSSQPVSSTGCEYSCFFLTTSPFPGDDAQALVWEIVAATKGKPIHDPILTYTADSEINMLSWNAAQPEWIAVAFGDTVQALRV